MTVIGFCLFVLGFEYFIEHTIYFVEVAVISDLKVLSRASTEH